MIVLDTNVVSELVRQNADERVERWVARQSKDDLAVTTLSYFEWQFGLSLMPPSRRRSDLRDLIEEFVESLGPQRVLPLDIQSASLAATFRAQRQKAGRPVAVADSLIAGIALRHRATLATRNIRDFDGADLDIIDPWQGGSA
ncbi:type II toxin-antitoxin system VapC family toxin [Aureimonas psammosilenae]|uniref:type II toxin-antitoxin system VapC family toxin n=1 Tax=Aureimonas psammosilenae TaxID=2495496 RepID=UPI00186A9B51|nr:type II toxin-antitoxin system VapC family toxin [Aureimonas psammosilenae]